MKKLKFITIFALTIFMLSNFQIQGQTGLSGTGSNTCATPAGINGARSTFVGCGAGWANNNGGGSFNTYVGDNAGFNTLTLWGNVGVGHKALFTLSSSTPVGDSTHNVAVGNYALFSVNPNTNPVSNGYRNTAMGHQAAFSLTLANNSVAVGYRALFSNTTANNNTAVGFQALASAAGANDGNNTAVGFNALASTNGSSEGLNTAVGSEALLSCTGGKGYNTAMGYRSLASMTNTGPNTAVGTFALENNVGSYNVAVGDETARFNTTGERNCIIGSGAGRGTPGQTSYSDNTFLGLAAGSVNSTGNYNTFLGTSSGLNNLTGQYNSFTGFQSGFSNTASYNTFAGAQSGFSNTTGQYNVFSGYQAGYSNIASNYNAFYGYQAGYTNNAGNENTFIGNQSGYSNTTGPMNVFLGHKSGYNNINGNRNTFAGYQSAFNNTSGNYNSAFGYRALYSNSTSYYNTAIGYSALGGTSTANNTAIGYQAGNNNTTGTYNTFLGQATGGANNTTGTYNTFVGYAAIASGNYTNATAVGNGAIVNANDRVWLGNNIATVWTQNSYNISDGRFKFNVQENVKGLDFINKLRTVTYQMNTQQLDDYIIKNMPDSIKTLHQQGMNFAPSTAKIHSGFIAQEVLQAAQESGYINSIVNVPADDNDVYGLNYTEIVVSLVKAIQELNNKVDSLLAITNPAGTRMMHNNGGEQGRDYTEANTLQIELANNLVLYQNEPNPFGESTVIRYYIPDNLNNRVYIVFYDSYGKEIKRAEIKEKGNGQINADAKNLTGGIYSYSLEIDGVVKNTKKMMKE